MDEEVVAVSRQDVEVNHQEEEELLLLLPILLIPNTHPAQVVEVGRQERQLLTNPQHQTRFSVRSLVEKFSILVIGSSWSHHRVGG